MGPGKLRPWPNPPATPNACKKRDGANVIASLVAITLLAWIYPIVLALDTARGARHRANGTRARVEDRGRA